MPYYQAYDSETGKSIFVLPLEKEHLLLSLAANGWIGIELISGNGSYKPILLGCYIRKVEED